MSDVLSDTLQECLARIEGGATVDECLAAFPQQAVDLEGPLRAAAGLRALPRPAMPLDTRAALSGQMLALAAARRAAPARPPAPAPQPRPDLSAMLAGVLRALGYRGPLAQPWLRVGALAIALLLAVVLGVGAVAAARAVRNLVAPATQAAPFTLSGPIEAITPTEWTVRGATITVAPDTTITGAPAVGAVAQVQGELQEDGTLRARTISVELATPSAEPSPTLAPATTAPAPSTAAPAAPTAAPAVPVTAPPAPTAAPPPGNEDEQEKEKKEKEKKEKEEKEKKEKEQKEKEQKEKDKEKGKGKK